MRRAGAVTAAVFLVAGCAGSAREVRPRPPSPLRGTQRLVVAFDYQRLWVGGQPEAAWVESMAAREPDYPARWASLKGQLEAGVLAGLREVVPEVLRGSAESPGAVLVVRVRGITPGRYGFFSRAPTVVDALLRFQQDGVEVEAVPVVRALIAAPARPTVSSRLGPVAYAIGEEAGRHLGERRAP